MGYVKRIICLANSFKIGGSCIAGKEILTGGKPGDWIRPISARPSAEIKNSECLYESGSLPQLLDIMDIHFLRYEPRGHQTENHVIDEQHRWVKVGEFPVNRVPELLDNPDTLWINRDSTHAGSFNCMSEEEAARQDYSLALIRPENFAVVVGSKEWQGRVSKTYRARFVYEDIRYKLQLTDPVYTNAFSSKDEGQYSVDDVIICASLTEPWEKDNNRCHKLVAGII